MAGAVVVNGNRVAVDERIDSFSCTPRHIVSDFNAKIFSGEIIDTNLFRVISYYAKKNPYIIDNDITIVYIGLATRDEHEGDIITKMELKESLSKEHFISIEPIVSLIEIYDNNCIMVEFDGMFYVLPSIAESILVKKNGAEVQADDLNMSRINHIEIIDPQYLKISGDEITPVTIGSKDYIDAHI